MPEISMPPGRRNYCAVWVHWYLLYSRRIPFSISQLLTRSSGQIGRFRIRFPVAWKIALARATGGTTGSLPMTEVCWACFNGIGTNLANKTLCVPLRKLSVFLCGKKLTAKEDAKFSQRNAKEFEQHTIIDTQVYKSCHSLLIVPHK